MSRPDRDILDQIDEMWDDRVLGNSDEPGSDDAEFGATIDALHRADVEVRPSTAFRQHLRNQLLERQANGRASTHGTDFTFAADHVQTSSPTADDGDRGDRSVRRRWWISHAGELAAMLLVIVVAIAAVIYFSENDGSSEPGGIVDDSDEQATATPSDDADNTANPDGLTILSFQEAQDATAFDLVMPEDLPAGYELVAVILIDDFAESELPEGTIIRQDGGDPALAFFRFTDGNGERPDLHLSQTNLQVPYQDLTSFVMPTGRGATDEGPTGELDHQVRPINGQSVFRTVLGTEDGDRVIHFQWYQDGLTMSLQVAGKPDDPENTRELGGLPLDEVERVIGSILQQRVQDGPSPGEMPAPQEPGIATDLTFDEAQAATPFDLVDPRDILEGYELSGVTVSGPPEADDGHAADARYVVIFEFQSLENPARTFQLHQHDHVIPPPGNDEQQQAIEIDGLTVTFTEIQPTPEDNRFVAYYWHQDGLTLLTLAPTYYHGHNQVFEPDHAVPETDVEAFVSGLIERRQSDEMPEEGVPAPDEESAPDELGQYSNIPFDQAQALTPFDLFDPRDVLDGYHLDQLMLREALEAGQPYLAYAVITDEQSEAREFHYAQFTSESFPITFSRPADAYYDETGSEIDEPMRETLEIDGVKVERSTYFTSQGIEVTVFTWYQDGLGMELRAGTSIPEDYPSDRTVESVPIEDLDAFLRAVILARSSDAGPT